MPQAIPECIHSAVFLQAAKTPHATALVAWDADNRTYRQKSYAETCENALKVANALKSGGVTRGGFVAVVLPKGMEQIYCTLGIQAMGAAYVPVGIHQPMERMKKIFESADISGIATDSIHAELFRKENPQWKIFPVEEMLLKTPMPTSEIVEDADSLAYVIFTSGTTGTPKGVMISHRGASNTIRDINERYHVTPSDTCIAISELDFDLSVYDIFGLLAAGGKVVVLSEDTKKEANAWKEIAKAQKVTLWNSVPALFEMFTIVLGKSPNDIPLKTILLSGDWIPLSLFDTAKRLWPAAAFVSLGGATEASIWSVHYEVNSISAEWKSIPYGKALRNQKIKVVDESGRECPQGEPGELWIGGIGVAQGYLNNEELTRQKFPMEDGEHWYKTGDKARILSDGNAEFLGRLDFQIKLGGYRIELGEIENVIKKNPSAANAVAVLVECGSKKEIAAAVIPNLTGKASVERRFSPGESAEREKRQRSVSLLIQNALGKIPNVHSAVTSFWESWLSQNPANPDKDVFPEISNEENAEFLADIVQGKIPTSAMLERDLFNPERLIFQSESLKGFLSRIAEEISKVSFPQVAFLNAKSGFAAEALLKMLPSADLKITLFEESSGLQRLAKERLSAYGETVTFKDFTVTAPVECPESFDFVIDAGFLHTFSNPKEAVSYAYCLLKKGGTFFALDFENFDPIAVVSSAVLENGFASSTRKRAATPLLTDEEWEAVFAESAFDSVRLENSGHFDQTILAKKRDDAGEILGKDFKDYLKSNLVPYMIPSQIKPFIAFPLSQNGKVNRKKIAELLTPQSTNENIDENYIGEERPIAEIWKALLGTSKIDRRANFFEIGGDSLLATNFIEKLRIKTGIEISLKEVFENAELDKLSLLVEDREKVIGEMEEGEI